MGVGVYHNDFNGSGSTFLVSGTLATQEEYEAYVEDLRSNDPDEEPMSYEAWCTQEAENEWENLNSILLEVGRELGMDLCTDREDATFGDDFLLRFSEGPVEAGIRSWQHDHVIGAGAAAPKYADITAQDIVGNPEAYAADTLRVDTYGMIASAFAERACAFSEDVLTYIRLRLMQSGFDCRFRTSGYTSKAYTRPDDFEAELQPLRERVSQHIDWFGRGAEESLKALGSTPEGRVTLIQEIMRIRKDDPDYGRRPGDLQLRVPLYDPDDRHLLFYDPDELQDNAQDAEPLSWLETTQLPASAEALWPAPPVSDLWPLPANALTASWLTERQARNGREEPDGDWKHTLMTVTWEDWKSATGQALDLTLTEEDRDEHDSPRP